MAQAAKALADGAAAAAAAPARQLQLEERQQAFPPLQQHREQLPPHGPLHQVCRVGAHALASQSSLRADAVGSAQMQPLCACARAQAWQRASSGTRDCAASAAEAPRNEHPAAQPPAAALHHSSSGAHAPDLPAPPAAATLRLRHAATMHDRRSSRQLRSNGNGAEGMHDSDQGSPLGAAHGSNGACHAADSECSAAALPVAVSRAAAHVLSERDHCGELMGEYILYRF